MARASIDIGTNTVLLLIATSDDPPLPLDQRSEITRLGEGVNASGVLSGAAIQRTLDVLKEYRQLIDSYGARVAGVAATSAARDAANGADFIARVKRETGFEVRILPGEEEARLTALPSVHDFARTGDPVLIMDVGGGSTEFIRASREALEDVQSLNLGSVRLTETFFHHDPPTAEEIAAARAEIIRQLETIRFPLGVPEMIGIAGTVTTMKAVELGMKKYNPALVHGSRLTRAEVERQIRELYTPRSTEQRLEIPGLTKGRADVILAGAMIAAESMIRAGCPELIVSDRGLRWGLLMDG
ncbi:MAG: Exopolyphosphatase 2 [Myxococcota bacterium]|nr:Exopolyphosphatase 2 [Myxococcota bacterium]